MPMMASSAILNNVGRADQGLKKVEQQRVGAIKFWRQADWTEEEKAKTLAPANQARDNILEYCREENKLTNDLFSCLKRSRRKTTKNLTAHEIEKFDFEMLQRRVQEEMSIAEKLKKESDTKNATSDKAISLLNNFVQYVGEYSGILEIMKEVDQSYGSAGYTALSVLLAVVVNAKRTDDLVVEAMMDLKNEYSRIVLASELYPTQKMRSYITTTYRLGIEFVQLAQEHYKRPVWRRFLYSIVEPPFLLKRKVKEISSAIAEISKEQNTLLNQRVHEIQTQLGKVDAKVNDLSEKAQQIKVDVNGLHTNREKERLSLLNNELSEYTIHSDQTVESYSAMLDSSFSRPPGLDQFSLDVLRRDRGYQLWSSSKSNSLLVLNGRTAADQTSFCWLSPASIKLASALREENRHSSDISRVALVEIYCHTKDFASDDVKQKSVIVNILLQLLEANPYILRAAEKFDHLRDSLSKSLSYVDKMLELLVQIMSNFGTVYFVIDRVDRISGNFMQVFLENIILKRTSTRVKAFFVVAGEGSVMEKIAYLKEEIDERKFILLKMDQGRSAL